MVDFVDVIVHGIVDRSGGDRGRPPFQGPVTRTFKQRHADEWLTLQRHPVPVQQWALANLFGDIQHHPWEKLKDKTQGFVKDSCKETRVFEDSRCDSEMMQEFFYSTPSIPYTLYRPSTIKYQPVPSNTDPVPPSINQYPLLTQYQYKPVIERISLTWHNINAHQGSSLTRATCHFLFNAL